MSMQGSAMMYVMDASLPTAPDARSRSSVDADELVDHLPRALDERRLDDHLVEAGGVRALQPDGVRVVREPEDRGLRLRVRDLLRVDPRDVADHEVGRVDAVGRDEPVPGEQHSSFPRNKRSTPTSRIVAMAHGSTTADGPGTAIDSRRDSLERGLELMRAERWFEAHEALEDEWRAAPEPERDFLQGLVHVTVAWYHAGERQCAGCDAPAREGGPAARPVRARAPRRRRRRRARSGRGGLGPVAEGSLDLLRRIERSESRTPARGRATRVRG